MKHYPRLLGPSAPNVEDQRPDILVQGAFGAIGFTSTHTRLLSGPKKPGHRFFMGEPGLWGELFFMGEPSLWGTLFFMREPGLWGVLFLMQLLIKNFWAKGPFLHG